MLMGRMARIISAISPVLFLPQNLQLLMPFR